MNFHYILNWAFRGTFNKVKSPGNFSYGLLISFIIWHKLQHPAPQFQKLSSSPAINSNNNKFIIRLGKFIFIEKCKNISNGIKCINIFIISYHSLTTHPCSDYNLLRRNEKSCQKIGKWCLPFLGKQKKKKNHKQIFSSIFITKPVETLFLNWIIKE